MNVRISDDRGFSLTELMVASVLMLIVIAAVYMVVDFAYTAQGVAETQSQIAREVTAPLNMMDISFSQCIPVSGVNYDAYSATARMPADYSPGNTFEHVYTATWDGTSPTGKLTRSTYRVSGATRTLMQTAVISENNVNQARNKPLFRYYADGGTTSTVNAADSLVIDLYVVSDGREYSDSRTIYFRNR